MPRYRCYMCKEDFFSVMKKKACVSCSSRKIKDIYLIEHAINKGVCVGCGEDIEYDDFYDNAVKTIYFEDGLCVLCQKDNRMK